MADRAGIGERAPADESDRVASTVPSVTGPPLNVSVTVIVLLTAVVGVVNAAEFAVPVVAASVRACGH